MVRSLGSQKRLIGLIATLVGFISAVLILLAATDRGLSILSLLIGLGILYGSYLIYRGKTSLFFGWGKTRLGGWINLGLGVVTLLVPGGVGGTAAILAILSGVIGLLAS